MADSPTKGAESLASAGLPSSDDGGLAVVERAWSCQLGTEQRELKGEDRFASRRLYATPEDMEASVHSVHSTQGNSRQVVVGQEDIIVVLVADGHGGRQASQYCRDHLLDYWVEQAADDPCSESLLKASEASCERVHREIKGFTTAGSTITIVALNLVRGELSVANLGDSEAWLVPRGAGAPIRLTEDHRLDSSEPERARVLAMGGLIAHAKNRNGDPAGPLRLWPGGIAQARAVGDADVGDYVMATPYTQTVAVPPSGGDVVIASDGVWDAIPCSAVAHGLRLTKGQHARSAAKAVVDIAINQRHAYDCDGYTIPRDDTTCSVMRIRSLGTPAESEGACCVIG